jgi:hypothetical protein
VIFFFIWPFVPGLKCKTIFFAALWKSVSVAASAYAFSDVARLTSALNTLLKMQHCCLKNIVADGKNNRNRPERYGDNYHGRVLKAVFKAFLALNIFWRAGCNGQLSNLTPASFAACHK